jgi:hypothetical protein
MMLSRKECTALRGLAILGIMLHNYCHWLRLAVKENEFTFTSANNERLLDVLGIPDWNLPVHLLSYFGHYGVPVFFFLSGYGLVQKYESSTLHPSPSTFIRYNYLKLFRMMIVGYVLFLMVDFMTPGPHHYQLLDVVAQLLMFNNLLPTPDKVIWPGPFWFFGMMMVYLFVLMLIPYVIIDLYFLLMAKDDIILGQERDSSKEKIRFTDERDNLKFVVAAEAVLYVQSDENYVKVCYLEDGEIKFCSIRNTMKRVEETCMKGGLIRCHRSYFVNSARVQSLQKDKEFTYAMLDVANASRVPVSKNYYDQLAALL